MTLIGTRRALAGTPPLIAGPQAAAFLARTSGLDAKHTNMYIRLINGLVQDGVWSKLDCLWVLATQNTTAAALNLVSSSFSLTANGGITFTADQGYQGTDASNTKYLATGFNPSTAGGNFAQNSAHVSVWSNLNVASTASGGIAIGNSTASGTNTSIFPRFSDGKCYCRINDNTTGSVGATTADSIGFYVATRNGASTQQGYKNGADFGETQVASSALSNAQLIIGASVTSAGVFSTGFGGQISAATAGGALSISDVNNLYSRLRTARAAVGLS